MDSRTEATLWASRLPLAELASLYWSTVATVPHALRTERERAIAERLFHPTAEKASGCSKRGGETWFR